jgi:hypothetical protein
MDKTKHDAARTAAQRPPRADGRQAGQRGVSRWDGNTSLRVSDAERDAVVTELAEHFQQGRLDQAEFEERITAALAARTGRDLAGPLADLPPAREQSGVAQPGARFPRPLLAVPLLAVVILIAGIAAGGWHHGWVPWPLWWLIPIMVLRLSLGRRNWRRRQWQ